MTVEFVQKRLCPMARAAIRTMMNDNLTLELNTDYTFVSTCVVSHAHIYTYLTVCCLVWTTPLCLHVW